mmetsp:Transcript_8395/g.25231  ORF Transcript_8395/g.25231 Transcript_8395/m.25231 type:complete len:319 (+) Transcript_8395:411-1367(+)
MYVYRSHSARVTSSSALRSNCLTRIGRSAATRGSNMSLVFESICSAGRAARRARARIWGLRSLSTSLTASSVRCATVRSGDVSLTWASEVLSPASPSAYMRSSLSSVPPRSGAAVLSSTLKTLISLSTLEMTSLFSLGNEGPACGPLSGTEQTRTPCIVSSANAAALSGADGRLSATLMRESERMSTASAPTSETTRRTALAAVLVDRLRDAVSTMKLRCRLNSSDNEVYPTHSPTRARASSAPRRLVSSSSLVARSRSGRRTRKRMTSRTVCGWMRSETSAMAAKTSAFALRPASESSRLGRTFCTRQSSTSASLPV